MTEVSADQTNSVESSQEISNKKIEDLKKKFDEARPKLRELLGIKDGEPDTFFIGVFGSTVSGKAREESDVDGYLFYQRGKNTSTTTISYDLEQCFDSPSSSIFGVPRD
jgi:predicted nucleotidyltransferase